MAISLHDVWKWMRGWRLDKAFHSIKHFVEKTAVGVTEAVKNATKGQIAQSIAATLDEAFHTHLASDALALLHNAAVKALALELGIEAVPDAPTADDIAAFEAAAYKIIAGKTQPEKARIWTSYASHLFMVLSDAVTSKTPLTWAQIVILVEEQYQEFKKAQEEDNQN